MTLNQVYVLLSRIRVIIVI